MSDTDRLRAVDARTLSAWLASGTARLVDVREPDEHRAEHISGSDVVSLSNFDARRVPHSNGHTVVLYCRSGRRSEQAARHLLAAGHAEVWHLQGGLAGWTAAGLPTQRLSAAPISIMRQVQIVAGGLVLCGVVLGVTVHPWFLGLSGFVGAGLVFAGASGTCAMGALLQGMPWNRATRGCAGGSCAVDNGPRSADPPA